jgi:hypothetical protein
MGIRKFFAYMYDTVAKTFKIGDTSGGNYTEFEADGTMRSNGDATTFDDAFPVQLLTPTGTAAPDLITVAGNIVGWGFDGASTSEYLYGSIELPHRYKEGSDIDFHLHQVIFSAGAGDVKWFLEYVWAPLNGAVASVATTVASVNTIALGDVRICKPVTIATISGAGRKISDVLMFRIYRNPSDAADTFPNDVCITAMGCHFEQDTLGSRTIMGK